MAIVYGVAGRNRTWSSRTSYYQWKSLKIRLSCTISI